MKIFSKSFLAFGILFFCLLNTLFAQTNMIYDIVLSGGRVIDPETKLDAIRNVGIIQHHIAAISTKPLKGKETIDVRGLVVAPGFIDLHVHGRSNKEQEYQLHDGLTTTLELEWGIEFLKTWYASRESKALINYGASVCWPFERFKAMEKNKEKTAQFFQSSLNTESSLEKLFNTIGTSYTDSLSAAETLKMLSNIRQSLAEGGIGIGVPIGYLPKNNPGEMLQVYQLAAENKALIFSHVREASMMGIQEAIADAMLTGSSLHIVHINSMALSNVQLALEMIDMANKKGFDISTEMYPYTAASTLLQSAIFNEGWREKLGMNYSDLQLVATGERLTKETFETYRKTGGAVIMHMMKPEWIKLGLANPRTIIASDGMPFAPMAHPRTAGTFSRVLGKYVREEKVIDLITAIGKLSYLPAKRLEIIAPTMKHKGRMQVGADADISIFNANTISDKASFEKGLAFSEGMEYVIVNGNMVLKNGAILSNTYPGQPIYGKFKK
jgi:dihydroorotase-like cyclic amidohydrolase